MFRFFEDLLDPLAPPGARPAGRLGGPVPDGPPPAGLAAFCAHFLRQARGLFALLFLAGTLVALMDAAVPAMLGRLVTLLGEVPPDRLLAEAWPELAAMAALVLVGRPLSVLFQNLVGQQAINGGVTGLVRWQAHRLVMRQDWRFFQEDFAGRIANRVMGVAPALREVMVQTMGAVWYVLVYGTSALVLLAGADWRLALPVLAWFVLFALLLRAVVPRMRRRSKAASEARSALSGRVVDAYTNILTVKLFARDGEEEAEVRAGMAALIAAFRRQMRLFTLNGLALGLLNAALIAALGGLSVWLWTRGQVGVGTVAAALPLALQLASVSGWVAQSVAGIFESLGTVQEAMGSLAAPPRGLDRPGAVPLAAPAGGARPGAVRFEGVRFGYGRTDAAVLEGLDLAVAPGERVGLVGRSGAGKTTAVNLLLRFFEPEAGRILLDGQDVAGLTQESVRRAVGVVTQDTALLHRSVAANIAYGRPGATPAEIEAAARRAHAHAFIEGLEDWKGRRGYEAHVGERGVKLSGGQRQRVAIARVLLKGAPVLVLDEATSALDSEVEAAIQEQLETLMEGRTVIAIAHRLSTLARMDRIVVLEAGRVVESGPHARLLRDGGVYAALWRRQAGGFLAA